MGRHATDCAQQDFSPEVPWPRSECFAGRCPCDGWRDRSRITGERDPVLVEDREPAPDGSAEQQSQWGVVYE